MKIELTYKQGIKGYEEFNHASQIMPDFCRGGAEDAESSLGNIVYNAIAACVEFGKYSTEINFDTFEESEEFTTALSNAVAEFMDWDQEANIDLKIDMEEKEEYVWYNAIVVEIDNKHHCRYDRVYEYEYLNGGVRISYQSHTSQSGESETFYPYHAFKSMDISSYAVYIKRS